LVMSQGWWCSLGDPPVLPPMAFTFSFLLPLSSPCSRVIGVLDGVQVRERDR
jgi:hypothetical protein